MIIIYGAPNTRTNRVLWALEEAKAEYNFIQVDLLGGETHLPAYQKLNPSGKVPTLVNNDLVLTESAAICTYIGDLFPDSYLTPMCGSLERAIYAQWCFFAMSELEQPLWSLAKHRFALPKQYRIKEMQETAIFEFNKVIDVFSKQLAEHKFLIGNHFTCADLIIADILNWANNSKLPELSFQHDNIKQYWQRMISREAFQKVHLEHNK